METKLGPLDLISRAPAWRLAVASVEDDEEPVESVKVDQNLEKKNTSPLSRLPETRGGEEEDDGDTGDLF